MIISEYLGATSSMFYDCVAFVPRLVLCSLQKERPAGGGEKRKTREIHSENAVEVDEDLELPWLQLLHVWVHDLASRDHRFRK